LRGQLEQASAEQSRLTARIEEHERERDRLLAAHQQVLTEAETSKADLREQLSQAFGEQSRLAARADEQDLEQDRIVGRKLVARVDVVRVVVLVDVEGVLHPLGPVLLGVRPRDRVGIYLPKSIDSVASIFGILKIGAAYVPVDPTAPAARNAYILSNCSVSAVVMDKCFAGAFDAEIGPAGGSIRKILLDGVGGGQPLRNALARDQENDPAPAVQTALSSPHDLAYILYTSGSTGQPKGVMLSHENAMSYVEWCSGMFEPHQDDRFSSHTLISILDPDIYVPIKHGNAPD
jgi:non-ribosomal peptide synthetase component F